MKRTAKFAAIAMVCIMMMSVLALGASAATTGSGSVSLTTSMYTNYLTETSAYPKKAVMNISYAYGAVASGKVDLLNTYAYNDDSGYKYADIFINGTKNTSGPQSNTTVAQLDIPKATIISGYVIKYQGYDKVSTTSTAQLYLLSFELTAN